jgi:DNA-binding LacI/PurR family transcriptional regulator
MVKTIRTTVSLRIRGLGQSVKQAVPVSAYEGGSVIEAMVEQALAENPPTAWIFFYWREFLAASCVFRDRGLSIPGHLSVVILSWDPAMDWYRPMPTHFHHPIERLAKEAAEWVLGAPGGTETRYFEAEWVAGASVGLAKR